MGPKNHQSDSTHLQWVSITFVQSQRVIRVNRWVKLVHSKANFILHISIEFLCQFSSNNIVIRMNPWLYLVQSTTQVILHISIEFKGHFFWSKKVMRMPPLIKLVQSTSELILHILTEFQRHCSWSKRGIRGNPRVYFDPKHRQFYTCPVSAKKILFEKKESSEWTHG